MWKWFKSLFKKSKDAPVINQLPPKPAPKREPGDDAVVARPDIPTLAEIADKLIFYARVYIGVREVGGPNKGPDVENFQRFVDGKARGEAWCMAFVQFIVGRACAHYKITTPLYPSEHCNTVYAKTNLKYLTQSPSRGFAFIMKNRLPKEFNGHTGICVDTAPLMFPTIEGNTNSAGSSEGDGVYEKTRSRSGNIAMLMRGYINLPRMIQDAIIVSQDTQYSSQDLSDI